MRSALPTADLSGKSVFLRADLNVPLIGGKIISEFRLEALRPTLDLLIQQKARIVLATHIGRPQGHEERFSTKHLLSWLSTNRYTVHWAPDLSEAQNIISSCAPGTIVLLENLRFFPEETSATDLEYAKSLRKLADYYVNDAWAVLHKDDISITQLPKLYTKENKTIGLLVEREIEELDSLREPERPFVMIMGGAKIKQKLPYIEQALTQADTIIVLPALAFTFMKAQGLPVGESLVDESLIPLAQKILSQAKPGQLILPEDYMVGNKDLAGPLEIVTAIPSGKIGIALGPKSLKTCEEYIRSSKSLFLNGTMGFFERPETMEPIRKLLQSIARTNTLSVVGGGESVAAVNLFELEQDISFCSTGGGATLYYLINGSLPALSYLL